MPDENQQPDQPSTKTASGPPAVYATPNPATGQTPGTLLPDLMRMDASRWVRKIRRSFPKLGSSAALATLLGRFVQSELRVKANRGRGRPTLPEVDNAEALWKRYRKESPDETKTHRLDRICPEVIDGWNSMDRAEQVERRRQLKGQLRARRNQRKRRRRRAGNKTSLICSIFRELELPWHDLVVKQLTREQVAGRKEKAERFVRNVLHEDERADEIAAEDVEDYADRRHFEIVNPAKRRNVEMASNKELQQRITELEDENADLNDRLDSIAELVGDGDDSDDTDDDDFDEDDSAGE
jgi:hypothetical protein